MRIVIPQINVRSGEMGVQHILEAFSSVGPGEPEVVLDFTGCRFISAEAVAMLTGMKLVRDAKGLTTEIDMRSLVHPVRRFLRDFQFLRLFDRSLSGRRSTSFPIYYQSKRSIDGILNYIDTEIMECPKMPKMSDGLQKEIRRAFFEIFGNVFYHSESRIGGLVCGQVYPALDTIQIVFYDAGKGLAQNVRQTEDYIGSDAEAIEWALRFGTSTLSNHYEPRGMGLYLLRQFLNVNKGEFRIYANTGIVAEAAGERTCGELSIPLKGTLIDMRIRAQTGVEYAFSVELEQ